MCEDSWFRNEPSQAHKLVISLIVDYVRYRNVSVDTMVNLWAPSGQLLTPLTAALNPRRSFGVVSPSSEVSSENHDLRNNTAHLVAHPDGVSAAWLPSSDLVVGIPPQRWKPKYIERICANDQKITLTDDPANIALLDACRQLSPGGLGCFVIGPGLLMRPGPGTIMANLEKFGLFLDGVIVLPQGSTKPNIGPGQNLLVISNVKRSEKIVGRLSPNLPSLADIVSNPLPSA